MKRSEKQFFIHAVSLAEANKCVSYNCFLTEIWKKRCNAELQPQYLLYCYQSLQVSAVSDCSPVLLCIYVLYCISEMSCYGFTLFSLK